MESVTLGQHLGLDQRVGTALDDELVAERLQDCGCPRPGQHEREHPPLAPRAGGAACRRRRRRRGGRRTHRLWPEVPPVTGVGDSDARAKPDRDDPTVPPPRDAGGQGRAYLRPLGRCTAGTEVSDSHAAASTGLRRRELPAGQFELAGARPAGAIDSRAGRALSSATSSRRAAIITAGPCLRRRSIGTVRRRSISTLGDGL